MNSVSIMLVAALLWSFYPVMIALSEGEIGAMFLVIVIHISCGLSAFALGYIKTKDKAETWHRFKDVLKKLNGDQWVYLLCVGLVSTLYNLCFILAMGMTSKISAAIIIEAWPIIAMFLAPILVSKTWEHVTVTDYVAGVIALIGVFVLMTQGDIQGFFEGTNLMSAVGAFLALIGSVCLALSVIFRAEISNRIAFIFSSSAKHNLRTSFMGEAICRLLALPSSLLLLFLFPEDIYLSFEGLSYGILTGIFIFNIGSVAVTLAMLRAKASSINMLYYLSPILAVVWLYYSGLAEWNNALLYGGALVILSNVMVIRRQR